MNVCVFYGRMASSVDYKEYGDTHIATFRFVISHGKNKTATFLNGKAFGVNANVLNNYFEKGDRISFHAHAVQPPQYENKNGYKVWPNVEFVVDFIEFVETKKDKQTKSEWKEEQKKDDFMDIPENISSELQMFE